MGVMGLVLLLLLFNQVYFPYRALELWQTMIHGLRPAAILRCFVPISS